MFVRSFNPSRRGEEKGRDGQRECILPALRGENGLQSVFSIATLPLSMTCREKSR